MLTISQLAAHAGVTVRAVRHYHQIGLLPEPERDHSGYRTYDAATVVRLIQIRTLAEAGVPLARVQELLDATPEDFAKGVKEIDKELHAEIRRLQDDRKRIARLAAGESLALPQSAVDYLDMLRRLGVDERYIKLERDAWIMVAARVPHLIDSVIAKKRQELVDPDMVKLYRLLSEALDWPADDPRIVEIADVLERLMARALDAGEELSVDLDDPFVDLLDTTMLETSPLAGRLLAILEERGWRVGLASSACLQNEAAAARATRLIRAGRPRRPRRSSNEGKARRNTQRSNSPPLFSSTGANIRDDRRGQRS